MECWLLGGLIFFLFALVIFVFYQINNKLCQKLNNIINLLNDEISSLYWNKEIQDNTICKGKYKPSRKIKVLVGEYNKGMTIIANTVLKELGLDTEFVDSGEMILNKISKYKYDFIITSNIYREGRNGPIILSKIRTVDKKIFVAVLTVSYDKRNEFINEYGFNTYLTKPLKIDDIKAELINNIKNLSFEQI